MVGAPVQSEECYRVLIDQLPGTDQNRTAVKLMIRQSIPLCFDPMQQQSGKVVWHVRKQGTDLTLVGENIGGRRIVAKTVKVIGPKGVMASVTPAVVLGKSTMSWPLKGNIKAFGEGMNVKIEATIGEKVLESTGAIGGAGTP